MAECSSEELARALKDRSNFSCSTRGEAMGLTLTVEAGSLSLLAILFVFLIIVRNIRWRMRHLPTARLRIFHQPMDIFVASLLIADVVQAVGAVLSLKWAQSGKVEVGPFCTAQGVIKILGATGVAFSASAIALYTLLGVWAMKDITSMKLTLGVVVTFWSFIAALIAMALTLNRGQTRNFNFIGPTPYWCWINKYEVGYGWKIAVEYLWLWLRFALTLPIYISLYLWMRGNLVIDDNAWWRVYFTFRTDVNPETRAIRRQSLVMLAYPAVDCICILPLMAVRWKTLWKGTDPSPAAIFAASSLFGLNGFFNVILLLKTRPSSGLFGQLMFHSPARPPSPHEEHDEMETHSNDTGFPPDFIPRS